MKTTFSGWYGRSAEELAALWDRAIFVPDANILLHCFRHSSTIREELLRIFELLKDSLWIPHQVGLEFHRNRLEVEGVSMDAYDRMTKDYDSIFGQAREKLRHLRAHPSIDVERELSALDAFVNDFRRRIQEAQANHPRDALVTALDRITAIFLGRVGAKPTAEKLASIRKEGEDRYAKRIPPGYRDAKKDGPDLDRFGDLIIWKDLMEKARTDARPLVFITDDVKEDWWQIHRGAKLGPRPELLEEFRSVAGQDFHLYELGQFLRISAERHQEIAQESVAKIERSVLEDEAARRRSEVVQAATDWRSRVASLENERSEIISSLAGLPMIDSTRPRVPLGKDALRARLAEIDLELAGEQASPEEMQTSECK